MIRIKSDYEDPRRIGERYLGEVPSPVKIGMYTHSDELWAYYCGSIQGRICEVRLAVIADHFLDGLRPRDECGYTLVALVLEPR